MKLIVGLGNPGRGYADNRHNIGLICLNYFARKQNIHFDKKQGKARIGLGKAAGNEVVLARPQTYMNRSGQSVTLLVSKFNISPENLFVIHDDLDLPLGKIRIRGNGSSGGHKGVGSIISELSNQDFIRIRIGIGRPNQNEDISKFSEDDIKDYVLSDFTPDEKQVITPIIPTVSEIILYMLNEGLVATMNKYN